MPSLTPRVRILKLLLIVDAIVSAAMDRKKVISGSCPRNVDVTVVAATIRRNKSKNLHNSTSTLRELRKLEEN